MPRIQQPSGQVKLTNVSLVRLKRGGKRFEIACYKNKVLEWRTGVEKNLDNVLQIPNVFINVSKGQQAAKSDLVKAFGPNVNVDDIVLEILNKGDLQVGEGERAAELERVHNEVMQHVASRLVDPRTKRVYTTTMIAKALDVLSAHAHDDKSPAKSAASAAPTPTVADTAASRTVWTGVVTGKSAKSQALEAIRALIAQQPIPVARARMRLRISCSIAVAKQGVRSAKAKRAGEEDQQALQSAPKTVKDNILAFVEQVEHEDVVGSQWEVIGFVEPGAFKLLSDFAANETKGQARVEVLDMAVIHDEN
jgi:ribosome maturation protein SDO1